VTILASDSLLKIIDEFKKTNSYEDEDYTLPLDTDEVSDLSRVIEAEINLIEGNIDEIEYKQMIDITTRKPKATTVD
jgi:hypothetical protein